MWINLLACVLTATGLFALVKEGEPWMIYTLFGAVLVFHIVTKNRFDWPD